MTDRLALIKARHAEAGGGDAEKAWLVAEVERLREVEKSANGLLGAIRESLNRAAKEK